MRYLRMIFFVLVLWGPSAVLSQNRVRAVSRPGPISNVESVIVLWGLGLECHAELSPPKSDVLGDSNTDLVITIKNCNTEFPVEPYLLLEVNSQQETIPSKLWIIWLERLAPSATSVFRWPLEKNGIDGSIAWRCQICFKGSQGEALCRPIAVDIPLGRNGIDRDSKP